LKAILTAQENVAQLNVMQRQRLATVAKIRQLTAQAGVTFTNLSLLNLIYYELQTN
jgi:hypothetical protein